MSIVVLNQVMDIKIMRNYKQVQKNNLFLDSVICDKCGKICSLETQIMDFQEWFHYRFIGGYESVFEDGGEYELDLCQQCTKKLLGQYFNYLGNRT